jgi:hypothetical protein
MGQGQHACTVGVISWAVEVERGAGHAGSDKTTGDAASERVWRSAGKHKHSHTVVQPRQRSHIPASRRWNIGSCPKFVRYHSSRPGRVLAHVAVPLLTHRRDTGPGIGLTCPGAAKPRKQDLLKSISSMSSMKSTIYVSLVSGSVATSCGLTASDRQIWLA